VASCNVLMTLCMALLSINTLFPRVCISVRALDSSVEKILNGSLADLFRLIVVDNFRAKNEICDGKSIIDYAKLVEIYLPIPSVLSARRTKYEAITFDAYEKFCLTFFSKLL
jgi:hypothetical protein